MICTYFRFIWCTVLYSRDFIWLFLFSFGIKWFGMYGFLRTLKYNGRLHSSDDSDQLPWHLYKHTLTVNGAWYDNSSLTLLYLFKPCAVDKTLSSVTLLHGIEWWSNLVWRHNRCWNSGFHCVISHWTYISSGWCHNQPVLVVYDIAYEITKWVDLWMSMDCFTATDRQFGHCSHVLLIVLPHGHCWMTFDF